MCCSTYIISLDVLFTYTSIKYKNLVSLLYITNILLYYILVCSSFNLSSLVMNVTARGIEARTSRLRRT